MTAVPGKLHPAATIRPRSYDIMVQFVPLTFRADRDSYLRELEEVNRLQSGVINRVRWIKPVAGTTPLKPVGISYSRSQPHPQLMTCLHTDCSFATRRSMPKSARRSYFIASSATIGGTWQQSAYRKLRCVVPAHSTTAQQTATTLTTCTVYPVGPQDTQVGTGAVQYSNVSAWS